MAISCEQKWVRVTKCKNEEGTTVLTTTETTELTNFSGLGIGFGFGVGCGLGVGWGFGRTPSNFLGLGAGGGCGVGFGLGWGFGSGYGEKYHKSTLRLPDLEFDSKTGEGKDSQKYEMQ